MRSKPQTEPNQNQKPKQTNNNVKEAIRAEKYYGNEKFAQKTETY